MRQLPIPTSAGDESQVQITRLCSTGHATMCNVAGSPTANQQRDQPTTAACMRCCLYARGPVRRYGIRLQGAAADEVRYTEQSRLLPSQASVQQGGHQQQHHTPLAMACHACYDWWAAATVAVIVSLVLVGACCMPCAVTAHAQRNLHVKQQRASGHLLPAARCAHLHPCTSRLLSSCAGVLLRWKTLGLPGASLCSRIHMLSFSLGLCAYMCLCPLFVL